MTGGPPDRASRVRRALVELVAERGLHGASMGEVARRAGVAAGTAYTYYPSKEELLLDTYRRVKRETAEAATAGIDGTAPPRERFLAIWSAVHGHLAADPAIARFVVQVEASPLAAEAHERALADGDDPLLAAARAPDMAAQLVDLPLLVLYELGLGPAVRLAAGASGECGPAELDRVAEGCWRAVTAGPAG